MAIVVRPEQRSISPRHEIADYSAVNPDQFRWQLNGYEQEIGLKDRLRNGDTTTIAAWRPDFNALTPLTPEQEKFAGKIRRLIRSQDPYLVNFGPGAFSQIRGSVLDESIDSLSLKLETIRARYREHEGEPDSTFWLYQEPIGSFSPAMLYRADLEAQIREEQEQAAREAAIERAKLT